MSNLTHRLRAAAFTLALAPAVMAMPAAAETLRIGLGVEPSSIDPHYHNLGPNNSLSLHVFGRLIIPDENQQHTPGLAVEWGPIDDLTWEFKLREGVKWHDGSPFTADDVLFTMERAGNVPQSPSSFNIYTRGKEIEVVDDHTIRISTAAPYPLMANDMATIPIISRKAAEGKETRDFNLGPAAIGTGPYKFVEFVPGDRAVFEANPEYWGGHPEFDRVVFRFIGSDPARIAAVRAGDVDLIDNVPTTDIEGLKNNPDLTVTQGISNRVIYLHLDHDRDDSPFVKDRNGNATGENPLKDLRVRQAISKAIDRQAIVDRIMEGVAIPAGQLLPDGFFGVSPNLEAEAYDPDGAKQLLADAGYGDGFSLTLHAPDGRYLNDARIAQAIAQMLTRIGIRTSVETLPPSVFFREASRGGPDNTPKFSFILVGWGAGTGEASSPLRSLLATFDPEKGMGAANRGRYSNPEFDALVEKALTAVVDSEREKLLQQATEIAIGDLGVIPLHYQVNTWASRKGLSYTPRTDEGTQATMVVRE
jgi:peptide/nickel transport system substrate-binding protein